MENTIENFTKNNHLLIIVAIIVIIILCFFSICMHRNRVERERTARNNEICSISKTNLQNAGTFVWNIPSGTHTLSPELRKIYGFASNDIKYDETIDHFMSLIHPDDVQEVMHRFDEAFKTGNYKARFRAILPDNTMRLISACGSVIYDDLGGPALLAGYNLDVTPRARVRREL